VAASFIGGGNRVPRENHRPVASHWQTLSYNVASSIPHHERGSNSQHWWWLARIAQVVINPTTIRQRPWLLPYGGWLRLMAFNAIFNNISVISWQSVILVIGTDCTGSCKSNYHTITTTMAPVWWLDLHLLLHVICTDRQYILFDPHFWQGVLNVITFARSRSDVFTLIF